MIELKTFNGIEYSFDLDTKKITWKGDELNHEIHLFRFTQDEKLSKAIAVYSGCKTNQDLLALTGKTQIAIDTMLDTQNIKELSGEVEFTPDTLLTASLTLNDIKRFMNLITEKHFKFSSYQKNSITLDWEIVP